MKLNSLNLLFKISFLFVIYLNKKINAVNVGYDLFRTYFGNVVTLQPFHIDQITNQVLNQVNCSSNLGYDCSNCLNSSKLQASSLIGTTVNADEFGKVSLILFCYLMDLKFFCQYNSIPDYNTCVNYVTNGTGSIDANQLDDILENKIVPMYRPATYFFPNIAIPIDSNCIEADRLVKKYSTNKMNVNDTTQLDELFSQIIYMMFNKMKIGCKYPYPNWFIDELFYKYNPANELINSTILENLMSDLNLTKKESSRSQVSRILSSGQSRYLRRDVISLNLTEYEKCYSTQDLLNIYSINTNYTSKFDFHTVCPSLIYMMSQSLCNKESTEPTEPPKVSNAEKYGYGTVAIVIVSLLAILGIILLPCFKRKVYDDILMGLTALAVGTLFSDAMLHMLPEVLGAGDENSESSAIEVPGFVQKICGAMFALYALWLLEKLVNHLVGFSLHGHSHSHVQRLERGSNAHHVHDMSQDIAENKTYSNENGFTTIAENVNYEYYLPKNYPKAEPVKKFSCINLKKVRITGWMILVGDAVHNFADGIAIGASFSQSIRLGISTTIAVICHEIPHELGNYAVLVKCGFTHIQALLFNLLSASACLIGFYVGVSISTNPEVSLWIFTITAGMFIYISLVDLLPSVMSSEEWSWKMFIICNLAMLLGFAVMFLLVVFEDHIRI